MTLTPTGFSPYAGSIGPLNRTTPFTHRDNATFLTILKGVIDYINETLTVETDAELERIITEFNNALNQKGDDWFELFNTFIADIEAQIGVLNDEAIATLVGTPASETFEALTYYRTGMFAGPIVGIVGDGVTDDTAAINAAAIDAASFGVPLVFDGSKTYAVTSVTFPAGLTVVTNGATFKKTVNNNTYALKTADGFKADWLKLVVVGGVSNDAGIWVTGDNIDIGSVTVTTLTNDQVGTNALFIGETNPANARRNIKVRNINITGWQSPFRFINVINSHFSGGKIDNFVTGIYMQNFVGTVCENIEVKGLSPSATGGPGQNGVLVEATVDRGVSKSTVRNISVDQASEHAFRVGGGFSTVDLRFEDCVATRPGCINYNAGTGVGSTGGAGFKALGLLGHEHIGLTYTNCVVEDGNILGNGVDNFSAFNMGFIHGLTMTDCKVRKNVNATSAMQGLIIFAVKNAEITNLRITDCQRQALKMVTDISEEFPRPGIDNLQIHGGLLETATNTICITSEPASAPFKDIYIDTVVSKGSGVAFRAEATTTVGESIGSYTGCFAKFSYINSPVANATATGAPPINSVSSAWVHEYKGPTYGAFQSVVADGSLELNSVTGVRRHRKAGAWVIL